MREHKIKILRLLAVCYLAAVLLGAVLLGVRLVRRNGCVPQSLDTADAAWNDLMTDHPVAWAGYDGDSLVTTGWDAYLAWDVNTKVQGLECHIRSTQPVKDLQLYYTTPRQPGFDASRTIPLVECDPAKGIYRFALPGAVQVAQLRLDPTSNAGAFLEVDEILLNPPGKGLPLTRGEVLGLLTLPLLAALCIVELSKGRVPEV